MRPHGKKGTIYMSTVSRARCFRYQLFRTGLDVSTVSAKNILEKICFKKILIEILI